MNWQWQDDACWQSCSATARAQADDWLGNAAGALKQLVAHAATQPLVDARPEMLQRCAQEVAELKALSKQLVIIGSGGASLGGQTLCALADDPSVVRFLDNCDPVTLQHFFRLDKGSTAWCIVSKSGETVETLAAALALIQHYSGDDDLRPRVRVITANPASTLGQLATAQQWEMLEHPADLGGRYSAFSLVGLLPACYAGIDVAALSAQAASAREHYLATAEQTLLPHAVWLAANAAEKPMQLLMAYADRLRPATQWYKQLWAESLGKDGIGPTPVTAIGAIDQHSQLQLYLDGPRDKLITLWLPEAAGQGAALPVMEIAGLAYLGGHVMGDVMNATAEATATTLRNAGLPLRVLRGALSPDTLGVWMVRQMLETLLVAALLKVDPYSQPAVEEGKRLTRAALAARA